MNDRYKNILICISSGIVIFGLFFLCIFGEKDDFSESERRALASFPEVSMENIISGRFMDDFDTYSQDVFPWREKFRRIEAYFVPGVIGKKDNHGFYTAEGHVSKIEKDINPAMLDNAAARFRFLYDEYMADNDTKVYFSIIPDKDLFIARKNGYPSLDHDAIREYMKERTGCMKYIEVEELLSADDYYRTDTHWRQEKILDVAEKIVSEMGYELKETGKYKENTLDMPFYGVYSGQSALMLRPDKIKYLTGGDIDSAEVTSFDTGKPVKKDVYDMEKAYGKDPYEMFLSGSDALIVIENPEADREKKLVVFRDSFAGSLAPLMIEAYSRITMVDIRYIDSRIVGHFADFKDSDVLFIYSSRLLNDSLAFK